jgi:hypothetical protein
VPCPPPSATTEDQGGRSSVHVPVEDRHRVAVLAEPLPSASASATERCRPPVQPRAMVRYDFPSRSNDGRIPVRSPSTFSRKSFVSGWEST